MTAPTLQLSDLAGPGPDGLADVAVFVRADGSEMEPFVVLARRETEPCHYDEITLGNVRQTWPRVCDSAIVRRIGRGRLVPARIEMEGEADLAAQVKMLREALQLESARLSSSIHCGEMHEQFGPSCSHTNATRFIEFAKPSPRPPRRRRRESNANRPYRGVLHRRRIRQHDDAVWRR